LQNTPTQLNFNTLENFQALLQFFQEREDQGDNNKSLLHKLISENSKKIIALFDNINHFLQFFKNNSNSIALIAKFSLIKETYPLAKNLDQLHFLLLKSGVSFHDNQEALVKFSLLFKTWDEIITYSDAVMHLPQLFKANPQHFAKLFSDPEQIIKIYKENPLLAGNLVRSLGLELAHLYTTTDQLQPIALMSQEVAEAIGKQKNIFVRTTNTLREARLSNEVEIPLAPVAPLPKSPNMDIGIMVLGGFITAIGIAAVALGFVLLSLGIPLLLTAGVGVAATLIGIGVFSAGMARKEQSIPISSADPIPSM
jgi:hypothetical protein